jgi:hypothetical protein
MATTARTTSIGAPACSRWTVGKCATRARFLLNGQYCRACERLQPPPHQSRRAASQRRCGSAFRTRQRSRAAIARLPAIRCFTPARRLTNAARPTAASTSRNSRLPAGRSSADANSSEPMSDAAQNDGGQDARRCGGVLTRCSTPAPAPSNAACPNLCLTINGGPACQIEGPARTQFTSWRSCGGRRVKLVCATGFAHVRPSPVDRFSRSAAQARVCAIHGDSCEYVVFVETEGGGTARRCRTPDRRAIVRGWFRHHER